MNYKKILLLLLVVLCSTFSVNAQELTVKKMETLTMDTYASTHKRVDNNGTACAVVKVSLPLADATFSGTNHLGSIDRIGADYIVFMPAGSKKMYIQHPSCHELEVNFADYGIAKLQSLATYRVTVNAPQTSAQQKMQTLNIKVTPSDAVVIIDGEVVDGNSVELTVGTHKYNVASRGYYAQEGAIEVKENSPAKLLIELDRKQTAAQSNNTVVAVPQQQVVQQVQQPTQPVQHPAQPSQPLQPVQQQVVANVGMTPQTFTVNGVSFTMMPVEGGTFTMGATAEQGSDAWNREKPAHQVTLSSYYIGKYEVTQELWQAVMGKKPSKFKGYRKPVEKVSWKDCQKFIKKLNSITGKPFRLPTEAEWEFASRGGNKSRGYKYSGSNNIEDVAWYRDNSGKTTHDVGTKSPNELGIYDMSGNVWEWCQDWYGNYSSSSQTNPTGAYSGSDRVYRGSSWDYGAGSCRVSNRYGWTPDIRLKNLGLRLALSE